MGVPLNIDWQQILLHMFNLIILTGGLYFLLYQPVTAFMKKRQEYYAGLEAERPESCRRPNRRSAKPMKRSPACRRKPSSCARTP